MKTNGTMPVSGECNQPQVSLAVINGLDSDVPVAAAHSGRYDDPAKGISIPKHFAYTGIGDEAVNWQTEPVPPALTVNRVVIAFYVGLRKDTGAWSWFELRLEDRPLVRFRDPHGGMRGTCHGISPAAGLSSSRIIATSTAIITAACC